MTNSVNIDEIAKLKNEISKSSKEQLEKTKLVEDSMTKKINSDIKDTESKLQKIKDEIMTKMNNTEKKIEGSSKGLSENQVSRLMKASKDELNTSIEAKIK